MGHQNITCFGVDYFFSTPLYKNLDVITNAPFPIIVTYGDGDIYGEIRYEVYVRYPNAEFHVIEDCGHIPWYHNPERFGKILTTFYSIVFCETTSPEPANN